MKDLHMHSTFSDGKNTAEEMVLAAIRLGLDCVGLSEHAHADGDDCAMSPENTAAYRTEMARLKKKYEGRIRVLCGIELDYYSDDSLEYDYSIGSVHSIRMPDGHFLCVDWTEDRLKADAERYFGGDWMALAEAYYETESRIVEKTDCDIIGHFDLLTKFNEGDRLFSTEDSRYRRAWQQAADALLATGRIFEINTGAMSRGYRTEPYPSREIREYIRRKGGRLILSSDSHRKETVAYRFADYLAEAGE